MQPCRLSVLDIFLRKEKKLSSEALKACPCVDPIPKLDGCAPLVRSLMGVVSGLRPLRCAAVPTPCAAECQVPVARARVRRTKCTYGFNGTTAKTTAKNKRHSFKLLLFIRL